MVDARRSPVLTLLSALVVALGPAPLDGQEDDPAGDARLHVGSRVRVTTDDGPGAFVGWVDAPQDDGFRLVRASDHTVVPITTGAIRRLELSRVRRSWVEQAAPGMIAGGLLGLTLGVVFTEEHSCDPSIWLCFDFGSEKLLMGIAGASVGTLTGGLISLAIVPADSWTDVPPAEITLTARPHGAGVALVIPLPGG